MIKSLESSLSDEQGRLFEMSADYNLDSETFIKVFMSSSLAKGLDSSFNHLQWAGRAYIMETFLSEYKDQLRVGGVVYDKETLYWMGYIFRRWHFYTGETSKEILRCASPKRMKSVYLPYHAMSDEMAIDRLKEASKKNK